MDFKIMSIGEVAANIPRATSLFKKYRIDFCCTGSRPVTDEFIKHPNLEEELNLLCTQPQDNKFLEMTQTQLIQYILQNYHEKHRRDIPEIQLLASKVEKVHAEHKLCPHGLTDFLKEMSEDLEDHMQKEESILFPILKSNSDIRPLMPIKKMMDEHLEHKKSIIRLEELSLYFTLDESACPTWRALYTNLQNFIGELQEHIHLENNVLFKKAMKS